MITRLSRTWLRFAFEPGDAAPMAALRIACGVLVLGWTLSLIPDAGAFLADDGLVAQPGRGGWGFWSVPIGPPHLALALLAAAAVALTLGWRTRLASVLVVLLLVAVQRRDVFVLNSGDLLLRELALFVALMPAGEVWSVDERRRTRPAELRAPWALRLLQLQLSAVYLFSVTAKLRGETWNGGTAVGTALQLEDLQRFALPDSFATSLTVSAAMTYATLVVEGALVVGLWLPRARWWVMSAGLGIHLGIEGTLLIGWFSLAMLAGYLAFVPAEVLRRVLRRPPAAAPTPTG